MRRTGAVKTGPKPRTPIRKRRSKPRRGPLRNNKYKQYLYDKPCEVCGNIPSDPAHTKNNGTASKGPDSSCAPLCRLHHQEYDHGKNGKRGFETKYNVVMASIAEEWYTRYLAESGAKLA